LRQLVGNRLGPWPTLGAIVLLEAAMVLLALGWDAFKRRHPKRIAQAKWLFAAALGLPLV